MDYENRSSSSLKESNRTQNCNTESRASLTTPRSRTQKSYLTKSYCIQANTRMIRMRTNGEPSQAVRGPVSKALLGFAVVAAMLAGHASSFQLSSVGTISSRHNRTTRKGRTIVARSMGMDGNLDREETTKTKDRDLLRQERSSGLLRLAKLSLQDYEWRIGVFKDRDADRKVEESLARMMGDEASYVRPMDASEKSIGPLGLWEKESVEWLQQVIDEEARRAREIVRLGGILVRPMDASKVPGEVEELGPLGAIERRVVDFVESIKRSEQERTKNMVLRPKDVEESKRGPLGQAELRASEAIREILQSERMRVQESRRREGLVRPIDIPGPLGELEMAVLEIVRAEEQRKLEIEENNSAYLVRPMDAKTKGPLGELEAQATEAVKRLTDEERERVRNIQRYLDENRPMQQSERTALGVLETIVVGIVRAPILFYQIFNRVKDLLESEPMEGRDAEILKENEANANAKKK